MKLSVYAALLGGVLLGWTTFLPAGAEAKTLKECTAEWNANKASLQAGGKTRSAYIAECRGVSATVSGRRTARLGSGQFASEAEAKMSCPFDTVVWVNLRSRVYHTSASPSYGKTKRGAYMCEKDTAAAGYRAFKAKRAAAR
jgi:hypothetical protein